MPGPRQPYLFDLVSCVNAPSLVLSRADGQVAGEGVQGWQYADRRFLSRMEVRVDGVEPVGLRWRPEKPGAAVFDAVLPGLGDPVDDPTVFVERRRELSGDRLTESITVSSRARREVRCELTALAAADLSAMGQVRTGAPEAPVPAEQVRDGLEWARGRHGTRLRTEPAPDRTGAEHGELAWALTIPSGGSVTVVLHAEARPGGPPLFQDSDVVPWTRPTVTCPDPRLPRLLEQGLDDLAGLLLRDPGDGHVFAAAGAPWFLTLFGRDSLWAARMLLPLGTDLMLSTLQVLARRQGSRDDPATEEQPGRILHEVRAEPLVLANAELPPVYYGTIDATPLFVVCCAEAWRWGADPARIEPLLPAVERCLGWLERQTGDGFLRYVDATGRGLTNQGWKDSDDGIQWADGTLAVPPVALSEVQGYAFQAAMAGADLLEAFDRPDPGRWRSWAVSLAARFDDAFWVADERGAYPAVALDGSGAAVDSVASNMAHLLGTGLLPSDRAALVAARLGSPDLDSRFGLRTLTSRSPAFSALSYHGGAVWPHDTAIAVGGLAAEGYGAQAASLVQGLLRAAPAFGFRLPELYGGDTAGPDGTGPLPYPAACRPQAWAAASPVACLTGLLGLSVDVPAGTVTVRPQLPDSLLPLSVSGLRVGGHELTIEVTRTEDGQHCVVHTSHPGVSVR